VPLSVLGAAVVTKTPHMSRGSPCEALVIALIVSHKRLFFPRMSIYHIIVYLARIEHVAGYILCERTFFTPRVS
jgi:hypothetical protein